MAAIVPLTAAVVRMAAAIVGAEDAIFHERRRGSIATVFPVLLFTRWTVVTLEAPRIAQHFPIDAQPMVVGSTKLAKKEGKTMKLLIQPKNLTAAEASSPFVDYTMKEFQPSNQKERRTIEPSIECLDEVREGIANLSDGELHDLVQLAFFWGMHPVAFYEMRYVYTQLKTHPNYVGYGRIKWDREPRPASDRSVTTPNATTLYGFGFYDLDTEPVVILTPEVPDRYFSVQALDQFPRWFMLIGNQFTGRQAQQTLVIGPRFTGPYPEGFAGSQIYQAGSDAAGFACRYALRSRDPGEVSAVNALMDATTIVPLSVWEANGRRLLRAEDQPLVEPSYATFPRMAELVDIASGLTAADLLQLVSLVLNDKTMTLRTDSAKELDTLARISRLGLRPGVLFDPSWLTEAQHQVAETALSEAKVESFQHTMASMKDINGWVCYVEFQQDINDYVRQGFYGLTTIGAAIPTRSHKGAFGNVDIDRKPLTGASKYTLTFDTDNLPPVSEFWELPLYDENGYFVDNELDRYSINSFMLERGELHVDDGKIIIYIQHERPSDPVQLQNWLPAPEGSFRFAFRFYGPMDGLLGWTYDMPGIIRTGEA